MKKLKNNELNPTHFSLKHVKEGKIKKRKAEIPNRIKHAVGETVDLNLAPKKPGPKIKKTGDDGDRTKKNKNFKKESKSDLQKAVSNNETKIEVAEKQKKPKDIKNKLQYNASSEETSKAVLKKIEKKKAKKLAKKLKKQLMKAQNKVLKETVAAQKIKQENERSSNKFEKGINEDPSKKPILFVNGKHKSQELETAENKNVDAINPELTKKMKKAVRQQQLRDQKQKTSNNKNFDTKSGNVLAKEEKKAMRMQLIEDQKLKTADNRNVDATSVEALTKKEKKSMRRQVIEDLKLEGSDNKNVAATSGEVLTKKEKKAMRKNLAEDQKLEASDNQNNDATNKVLTKKEKKAMQRQLIKDQKLSEKPTRDPAVEEATVFVGNLPVNTKRVQLQQLFKKVGPVICIRLRSAGGQILHRHKQRKLAGSLNAYVVLQSKEKAEKALSLNGFEFKGNHLRVTLAAKKPENQDNSEAKRTVFIGNLKYSASEETLREIFSSCGEIEYVRCIRDGDKGCKGVAYVCFKTADAVGLALELNETIVDERAIHVERYNVKKLGAKKVREAEAEKEKKFKKGAKLRLEGKSKKEKAGHKLETRDKADDIKKSKKSEFRGVKVAGLKNKQKSKKKKSNDQMLQLAKKIAPKSAL